MDSIKSEKIHAIKKYKLGNQFLKNIFLYSFTALACLFFSIPSYMDLPKLSSALFNIKFVFIVGNIIIVALIIGESKIFSSGSASTNNNNKPSHNESYYEEYINSRQSLQRFSSVITSHNDNDNDNSNYSIVETTKTVSRIFDDRVNNTADHKDHVKYSSRVFDEKRVVGFVMKKLEGFDGTCCDEVVLPTEELKKRSDDFIARVNKRRVFEARELLCDM